MKILHTADIHLGAKNVKLSLDKQNQLKIEQNLLISKLFEDAYNQDYDIVLICGDLFHSKTVSSKVAANFFKAVEDFSRPVLYIKGNHDEKFVFSQMPKNFIVLDENNPNFQLNNTIFWGQVSPKFIAEHMDTNKSNILLLHGDIKNRNDRDYVDLNSYLSLPFNYIALGHIHSEEITKFGDIPVAYPGSLFSNGFDEVGAKGYIEVLLDENGIIEKFVEFCTYSYKIVECDITGLIYYKDILKKVSDSLKDCKQKDLVRLILTGYYSEECEKYPSSLLNELSSDYFYIEILDKSKLQIDFEKIKNEELSFKAEFLLLVEKGDEDEDTKNKICQIGIEALRGDDLSI